MNRRSDGGRVFRPGKTAAIICAVLFVVGCSKKAPENQTPDPVSVTTSVARIDTLVDRLTATGSVVVAKSADVTIIAPEAATIIELAKKEGDRVEIGDLLVRYDIAALTEAVQLSTLGVTRASGRVDAAQAELGKLNDLDAKGMVPRSQVDAAKNAVLDAQAGLNRANSDLTSAKARQAGAEVRAKFPGVVARRWHVEGDTVIAADTDPIIRIVDETQLQVAVPLSKVDLARIAPGLPIMVAPPGNPPEPVKIAVMPAADPNAAAVEVRLGFAAKTALTRDAVVDVEFVVDQRPDVLAIPRKAIQRDEEAGVSYVLVAGADNVAHKHVVTLGFGTRDQIQILSGIAAGDRVILSGFDQIGDGSAVTVAR